MRADFGFGAAGGPIWLWDNPFLFKSSQAEMRRLGLSLRLATVIVTLSGLLLGGLYLQRKFGQETAVVMNFVFHSSFPVVLFVLLSFVHVLLIANARASASISLADEARRATLPDLLLTPLRRAEMLLAMGVGPARSAGLLALAGLPVYALLGQFGGLTGWEIVCLYLLFAFICYQPPASAVPALSGLASTPEAPPGQFTPVPNRRMTRRASYLGIGFPIVLSVLFFGRFLGAMGGGWLTHLFTALDLPLLSGFSFLIFLSWPYYAVQLLSDRLPFFHTTISPLWYVLPLMVLQWAGSALTSASALSAGDLNEMRRLPVWTRAQTLGRWTARLAGLCALAVVWRAWVESGDTAGLASMFTTGAGWNAAGLLLLLGGFSLPNVCGRALAVLPQLKDSPDYRAPVLVLRRALNRSLRPLAVALAGFFVACLLGGLSPFAVPVYETAGKILLAGISTVFWAVGVRRVVPRLGKWPTAVLLYGVPFLALSVPGCSFAASLSPVSAWVRLFAAGPGLVSQFPLWHLGTLPPLMVSAAVPFAVGIVLMALTHRVHSSEVTAAPTVKILPPKRVPARHEALTATLMGWVTEHTDNPLFIYEMRVRTRSGRWLEALCWSGLAFAVALGTAFAFPDSVRFFSFLLPISFFNHLRTPGTAFDALVTLGSLLLVGQCYFLGFRGQVIGEGLIARDRQQGTWGFLLLSPLTIRQIFWGKVFGQTASVGVIWAGAGLASLIVYGLASPLVEIGPALGAWASGQLFVAALFVLGVSLGTALATFPPVQKSLRGLSTLLFVLVIGLSAYAQFRWVPLEGPEDWSMLALRLLGSSIFGFVVSALLFGFSEWRLTVLRGRDIAAGDGVG